MFSFYFFVNFLLFYIPFIYCFNFSIPYKVYKPFNRFWSVASPAKAAGDRRELARVSAHAGREMGLGPARGLGGRLQAGHQVLAAAQDAEGHGRADAVALRAARGDVALFEVGSRAGLDQLDRAAREGFLEPDPVPAGAPAPGDSRSFEGARLRYRVMQ